MEVPEPPLAELGLLLAELGLLLAELEVLFGELEALLGELEALPELFPSGAVEVAARAAGAMRVTPATARTWT